MARPTEPLAGASFAEPDALGFIDDAAFVALRADALGEPTVLIDLENNPAESLRGYVLVAGAAGDDGWTIDLSGHPRAADRAAFGLLETGILFERTGDDFGVLTGNGALPVGAPTDVAAAERQLAAVVEIGGSVTGRLAAGNDSLVESVVELAERLDLVVEVDDGEVWLPRIVDRRRVAAWAYTCADRVPIVGGRGCGDELSPPFVDMFESLDGWWGGTSVLSDQGGTDAGPSDVRWTNREAQQYLPSAAQLTPNGLELIASQRQTPSGDRLPFQSGLVFSREGYGFGWFEFDIEVPTGIGLWPAVWMLDTEGCEAPGRCPGCDTVAYHEIDVLETAGDDVVFHSVHWNDGQLRSTSQQSESQSIAQGGPLTIGLERRPGLLVWTVGDQTVATVTGPAVAGAGIHRTADMMLIMNLAVGGSFGGERIVDGGTGWQPGSLVPASFPDLGWKEARLVVYELRVTGL
ncbi:MAG: hypothetical protein ACI8TP_003449 [Acidimicrobiales bacterium]